MRVKYAGTGIIFLWFAMGMVCFAQSARVQLKIKEELKETVDKIKSTYDVDVYYDQDFLIDGQGNRISSNRISPQKALQALGVVETFLKAYPIDFVHQNIGEIYLSEGLKFNQQAIGGLSGNVGNVVKRSIILDLANSEVGVSRASGGDIDAEFALKTLHHELSHNMMFRYQNNFPFEEWMAANGKDFQYYGTGRQFIEDMGEEECAVSNDKLRDQGFVKGYSQASVGEDVATLAEVFYVTPRKLSKWMKVHPKLARKVELFDQFYRSIGAK